MAFYTPEQLKQLHKIEIDILKEIERVCKKLHIQFFADWGTLLGAVRHQGFIPWDDDIDICMMREDYDRFITEAPKLLQNGYTLQHFLTDSKTPTYQAKVRKDGTLFVEDYMEGIPIHQGIFVDIFPYDNTVENIKKRTCYERKARNARRLFVSKSVKLATNEKNKLKRCLLTVIRHGLYILLLPVSKEVLYRYVDRAMQKYKKNESGYVECCANVIQKKDDIFPLVQLPFEGTMIYAPHNWHAILQNEYGEYMQLPPKEKQYCHCPKILNFKVKS